MAENTPNPFGTTRFLLACAMMGVLAAAGIIVAVGWLTGGG